MSNLTLSRTSKHPSIKCPVCGCVLVASCRYLDKDSSTVQLPVRMRFLAAPSNPHPHPHPHPSGVTRDTRIIPVAAFCGVVAMSRSRHTLRGRLNASSHSTVDSRIGQVIQSESNPGERGDNALAVAILAYFKFSLNICVRTTLEGSPARVRAPDRVVISLSRCKEPIPSSDPCFLFAGQSRASAHTHM